MLFRSREVTLLPEQRDAAAPGGQDHDDEREHGRATHAAKVAGLSAGTFGAFPVRRDAVAEIAGERDDGSPGDEEVVVG